MNVLLWAGLVVAGGAGAVARFLADTWVASLTSRGFPAGTLAVNLSGAAVLGLLTGLALSPGPALVAGTGVIGSYTTFSTWMLETERLAEERQHRTAVANVAVSLVAGAGAAALGRLIGTHL
jgi:fluoride exporter